MTHLTRSLVPLAILTLSISRLTAADTIEIKQQWPVGKKLSRTMKMEQSSAFEIAGQKMDQKMNMTMETSTGVAKHEDGKQKRLAMKYDRMALDMTMGPQKVAYDSAKPQDDPLGMGKAIGGIVGKEFKILVNEKDEISGIENYDEIAAGLGAGSPIGQMFGKDQLTEMVKQGALQGVPGKPVKVGDSWPLDVTMKLPQMGAFKTKGTYTLKSVGSHDGVPSAEIAVNATIGVDAATDGAPSPLGLKITDGKMTGTMWFDQTLGMVRSSDITTNMSISMKNPTQPDATMTIPTTQHITQTLTKVEDSK